MISMVPLLLCQTDVPIFFFNKFNKFDLLGNDRSFPQWLSSKESACNAGDAGDVGLIPRLGRSPGGGHGNPFQYSGLENPMDCSPPGSSVHGVLQARILEWVAISFSRGSSQPRNQTWVSCICRGNTPEILIILGL